MFGGGRDGIKTAMIWALCHSTQHLGSGQIQFTRKHHSRRYPQKCSTWWSRYSLQVNAKRLPSMTLPFSLCLHLSFYHKTTARKHSLTPFSTCLDLTKRGKDWSYKKFSHLLCTVPVHLLFLFFLLYFYVFKRGREAETEKGESTHVQMRTPSSSLLLKWLKQGLGQVSHVQGRDPSSSAITCCLSGCTLAGSQNRKRSRHLNPGSEMRCRHFNSCTKCWPLVSVSGMLPLKVNLLNKDVFWKCYWRENMDQEMKPSHLRSKLQGLEP